MVKVAIVDDEKIICIELTKLLKKYENEHKTVLEIHNFNSGEDLIDDIKENSSYDLILLDIELAEINGIEVGCFIRNTENDHTCQIIYISSKTGYAMELFQVRPFDFLIKPIEENRLFSCLDDYMKLFSNEMYFEYVNKKMRKLIPVSKIYYFESCGRKIIIHFSNGQKREKYEYYGKMQELIDNKCLTNFVLIHKSFFVNIFHILSYSYEEITVTDGAILTVSKPNRKEVRRRILEYSADKF